MDVETFLDLYRDMWMIRAFEFGLEREFKKGNVPGMLHTGLGQEATQTALAAHLQKTDCFFPDHRCHGLNALAQEKHGGDGKRIMAELFGKATGVSGGKGGSLHSADPKVGNFGDNAVEGSFMATVLGVALAWQMRREPRVACCVIGDGTVGRGEFHESLNMAKIWKLPVLYACVNNGYAISTAVGDAHASADIVDLARGYGMPCVQVDGNDIEAAHEAVRRAVEHIRSGLGPYFFEFKTWRWQGVFSGEFVSLDRVKLDVAFGDTSPRDIPIYIGATGDQMLELAGEIGDGVVLNYVVSADYIRKAVGLVEQGARKAGRTLADVDRPELLVCCPSDTDPAAAMAEGKKLVAYYLATEPHIMKASNVSEDLLAQVQAIMGWPATEEDYVKASRVIPDDVVRNLMAVGTAAECRATVKTYIEAGVTCPILYPMLDDIKPVVDAFAEWTP